MLDEKIVNIIPKPQKITEGEGFFGLDNDCGIMSMQKDFALSVTNTVEKVCNIKLESKQKDKNIVIRLDENYKGIKGGYTININSSNAELISDTNEGLGYAVTSFCMLILQFKGVIRSMTIEDYPRFKYRGFMLDVGRYFYTVDEVKSFIDIMSWLKLNYLHLHLTEDQGWRVEIKKYPLLTQKGSIRSHTNFNHKKHGGFYTQEEIRQIVEYANGKFIKVIPEIDMPGHMVSAIACYPYLSCFDRKLEVATHWGVKHDILCAGKSEVLEFVKDVISEIMELFPDGYIHLGGDEAVKTRWKLCPNCQNKIKELGLKDENELQVWFMNEVAKFVKSKGYTAIMWNEDKPRDFLDKSIIWNLYMFGKETDELAVNEANGGRKLINVQSNAYYFDLPYNTISLKTAYDYEPMLKGITACDNMLGTECDLWTEYVPNMQTAFKRLFPRIFAMAESAWTESGNKNYEEFLAKLTAQSEYIAEKYGYTGVPISKANPSKLRGFFEQIWFNRRVFHWQGLHNLIDNAVVAAKAKKLK